MSAVTDLLEECSAAGVELYLDTGRLRYRARVGAYTEALRRKVAAYKAALIAELAQQTLEAPQGGAATTLTNGQAADVSTPVKHTRRRALASTPPPATLPLTNGHYAFLYSLLRNGVVERGTLVSPDIRSEPETLEFLRKRYPGLKVQWARLVTHPVCGGCSFYTAAVLCNADQSPDHAAVVGSCGKYEKAAILSPCS